jgi:hypothetical protein
VSGHAFVIDSVLAIEAVALSLPIVASDISAVHKVVLADANAVPVPLGHIGLASVTYP